jgi:hypothetical protein
MASPTKDRAVPIPPNDITASPPCGPRLIPEIPPPLALALSTPNPLVTPENTMEAALVLETVHTISTLNEYEITRQCEITCVPFNLYKMTREGHLLAPGTRVRLTESVARQYADYVKAVTS